MLFSLRIFLQDVKIDIENTVSVNSVLYFHNIGCLGSIVCIVKRMEIIPIKKISGYTDFKLDNYGGILILNKV